MSSLRLHLIGKEGKVEKCRLAYQHLRFTDVHTDTDKVQIQASAAAHLQATGGGEAPELAPLLRFPLPPCRLGRSRSAACRQRSIGRRPHHSHSNQLLLHRINEHNVGHCPIFSLYYRDFKHWKKKQETP